MTTLYLDDFARGQRFDLGTFTLTADEIVAFARAYDPQPFHLSEEGGRASPYGGLIASGWHTGSIMMNLLVEHFISPLSSMGSPGLDEVRWPRPVRPGDVLRIRVSVIEKRRSVSKPDRGLLRLRQECINQRGETVMSLTSMVFCKCRSAQPAAH